MFTWVWFVFVLCKVLVTSFFKEYTLNIEYYSTSDEYNRNLLAHIQQTGEYHLVPTTIADKYVIRFCVNYEHSNEEHIGKFLLQI